MNKCIPVLLAFLVSVSAMASLKGDVDAALVNFKRADKGFEKFLGSALGYVVYPNVGKGGFVVGGAHGSGLVFEGGKRIGKSELVQATIGLQAGGQEFSEIVCFETKDALSTFKRGKVSLAAQVSAVIAAEGATAKARYQRGIAVFVLPKGGLMVEASVGGQKLSFEK